MSKLDLRVQVPSSYDKNTITGIIAALTTQLNLVTDGRIAPLYSASTVPSGSAVSGAVGDKVWDSNPTVRGSVAPGIAASYVRTGWICTVSGTPGTWQEMRVLTGS